MKTRILACIAVVALLAGSALLITPHSKVRIVHAQVVTQVGQTFPSNQFAQSAATGLAGAVTNPASNFVINIAGGPIYFNGGIDDIAQTTMTLSAGTTNLVVWNGQIQQMYAKQAVTGPGSNGTSAINGPGVPTSLLFAVPNVEIPLATVVCGSTNCGNTANGSITDNRPLGSFPAGQYVGGHLNQSAAGTTSAGAGTMPSTAGICTASAATTCVVTFSTAFQNAPTCAVTDQTNAIVFKALPSTTTLTITAASNSDTWSYICVGNPN
jgi:hypothetical protein